VAWCLRIVGPFIHPIIGGVVIAIALQTPYGRLKQITGGRPRVAAALITVIVLLILMSPAIVLGASLVETARHLSGGFAAQDIALPPPPDGVARWPLIGQALHAAWLGASENLEALLAKLAPYLKDVGLWLVSKAGDLGWGLLMVVIAIVISGVLLPYGERGAALARRVASMVAGDRGPELAALAASSIRNVTRGVLGVAAIQSVLAGLAMLLVGVPGAGLWTLLILIVAVMQLPTLLVLLPLILYVFWSASTWIAVLFTIWAVLVGLSDNVLKPLLMGRGSKVPTLVLFIGSLGGFIAGGILGLFVGAVVLSLGYTVFLAWLEDSPNATP
jgi:predicted PurR-regulated permease PerM